MTLVRSFFIILLLFVSSGAHAAVSCDALLSFASSAVSEETKDLSPSARAYVNLIKLYVDKSGGELDLTIANEILSAKGFINPFEKRRDSVSTQMASAVKTLESKIEKQDWLKIQSALGKVFKSQQVESRSKARYRQETREVLNPKISSAETQSEFINAKSAWYRQGKRLFFATTFNSSLGVYELINGQLKLIGRVANVNSKPVWQAVKNRLYIGALSGTGFASIIEIKDSKIELAHLERVKTTQAQLSMAGVGESLYFSISEDQVQTLYEFVNGKAKQRERSDGYIFSVELQSVKDRLHMFSNGHTGYLFELMGNELIKKFETPPSRFVSAGAWRVIGSKTYLTFHYNNLIYLYKIKNGALELKDSQESPYPYSGGFAPTWFDYQGRTFVFNISVYFPFANSAREGSKLTLFEVVDEKLIFNSELKMDNTCGSYSLSRAIADGSPIVNVDDNSGKVHVINLFEKFNIQKGVQ